MTHHGPGRNSLFYKGEQWITLLQCNAVKHLFQLARKKLDEQDWLQFFCNLNSPKKNRLPIGQVKNRIHEPDRKNPVAQAIGHHFLCTLIFIIILE